jgi:peptidoglycan/LPS O-acetylase OafA/YrhL
VAPLRHVVVWLSHHAYVLYLSHVLILSILTHYKPYGSVWSALAMYIGACGVVATAARLLVEKPFMDLRPAEIGARDVVANPQAAQ